jgi:hypothetical protein
MGQTSGLASVRLMAVGQCLKSEPRAALGNLSKATKFSEKNIKFKIHFKWI